MPNYREPYYSRTSRTAHHLTSIHTHTAKTILSGAIRIWTLGPIISSLTLFFSLVCCWLLRFTFNVHFGQGDLVGVTMTQPCTEYLDTEPWSRYSYGGHRVPRWWSTAHGWFWWWWWWWYYWVYTALHRPRGWMQVYAYSHIHYYCPLRPPVCHSSSNSRGHIDHFSTRA